MTVYFTYGRKRYPVRVPKTAEDFERLVRVSYYTESEKIQKEIHKLFLSLRKDYVLHIDGVAYEVNDAGRAIRRLSASEEMLHVDQNSVDVTGTSCPDQVQQLTMF